MSDEPRDSAQDIIDDLKRVRELVAENVRLTARVAELEAMKLAFEQTPKQWSTAQAPTVEAVVATARQISTAEENKRLRKERDQLRAELAERQKFKDWVHQYLDGRGVPHSPPGTHGEHGCRIGDRMDWVFAQLTELRAAIGGGT